MSAARCWAGLQFALAAFAWAGAVRLPAAHAHSFAPAVLLLREGEEGVYDAVWKVPPPLPGASAGFAALRPIFPPGCVLGPRARDESGGPGPEYWRLRCRGGGLRGQVVGIGGLEGLGLEAVVQVFWADGDSFDAVLREGASEVELPQRGGGRAQPLTAVLAGYGRLGVEHILSGVDHLLFLFGLLRLVRRTAPLVKTITAFTLAHSITLALAALGLVQVDPAPVETLIALSILLLAVELARPAEAPPTLARARPWVVAFSFGLLHGLGFAGALRAIGLPPGRVPAALLAFNVGVEAGQLAFVAAALPVVVLARHCSERFPPWLRQAPTYALGVLAAAWVIEGAGG